MNPDEIDDRPNLDDVIELPDLEPGDLADPCPAPPDFDGPARGYTIEIFGDERGGQTPKRPAKTTVDI